ncbi:hypothetical protein WN51_07015 [Melipona quadrifasciata]|uniref:Uncharacterized protein n=1 Tax=Melipona quadrifasciata TaxID=166423 RepID=A0A0N0BKB2_9HYME|nr:hypothetical protein WN51_07015 [Melipona quadrifasciata]
MATASNTTATAGETSGSNVPQWKRDLIQRRRQQSKVLASNGASVKLCSAVIGPSTTSTVTTVATGGQTESVADSTGGQASCVAGNASSRSRTTSSGEDSANMVNSSNGMLGDGSAIAGVVVSSSPFFSRGPMCGAIVSGGTAAATDVSPAVACNMRLEVDLSFSSDTEDVANDTVTKSSADMERKSERGTEMEMLPKQDGKGSDLLAICDDHCRISRTNKVERDLLVDLRAASLEDLLDCDDESGEKNARKYAKRTSTGVATKTDRYRNACRGNESMKRARSVETLMRYNGTDEVGSTHGISGRTVATNGLKQEPVNDHIILIDRSSVKIESRLGELDRPKPVNKPKRIKPLLAETERPPPDLVKTTMRIFEGSAKKLKPKGEVAVKVATFKTINDTFKAQAQKKIGPKPPIQPKPFVNGNSRPPASPKKIVLPQKPTAELIEIQDGREEYHMDGVITDPIVQSVSSVVSKFQQIEKSHSPSPSPEPSSFKLKFSPAPSPEPQLSKLKSTLEINVKSPPVTPVLSPRISSPRLHSPSSPMKDTLRQNSPRVHSPPSPMKDFVRQNSSPVHKPPPSPNNREPPRQTSVPEPGKLSRPQAEDSTNIVNAEQRPRQQQPTERIHSPTEREKPEENKSSLVDNANHSDDELTEEVDAPKTISKAALENIARTGVTMQFSFSDKSISNKSYLPGFKQNGQKPADEHQTDTRTETKPSSPLEPPRGKSFLSGGSTNAVTDHETVSRLQERLEPDKYDRKIEANKEDTDVKTNIETKPIGAICSLGLIKPSTNTSYPQGNELKTIKCQKTESPPQKQIGIIRPLVSTKTQHPQQNLSNRELEKNLINRVKSIEQPTKVVVSLKSADEIQPAKKSGTGGAGLWETKPWNQQNNTMVFNFSNRKDVPDYIENDGLIIKKKREKPKVGDGGIIVLDATLDASTTDDAEWELAGGPPSPCDVSFFNDNILINGRSNLSRTPRNHKHRIQFDDTATRTFEYPSEASMLEGESSVDGETSGSVEQSTLISNKTSSANSTTSMPTLLVRGGLASYTPSKVDLTSEGFELGVTRTMSSSPQATSMSTSSSTPTTTTSSQAENESEIDYLKPAQDAGAWGSETTGDLLY